MSRGQEVLFVFAQALGIYCLFAAASYRQAYQEPAAVHRRGRCEVPYQCLWALGYLGLCVWCMLLFLLPLSLRHLLAFLVVPLRQYLNRKLGSTWGCCRLSSACPSHCLSIRLVFCLSVCLSSVCTWLPPLGTPWAQRRAVFHCKPRTYCPQGAFTRFPAGWLAYSHTHKHSLRI